MLQFNLLFICRNNTSINQGDLAKALPFGLSYGMICSQVTDQKSSKTSISCAHLAGNLQRETLQRRLQGRRRRSLNSGGGRSYNRDVNKIFCLRSSNLRWRVKPHWWASSLEVWAVATGSPTGTPGCPSMRSGSLAFKRKVEN